MVETNFINPNALNNTETVDVDYDNDVLTHRITSNVYRCLKILKLYQTGSLLCIPSCRQTISIEVIGFG